MGTGGLRVAYLRTQFWFNLKAGGSVGHTAGVLSAMKDLSDDLVVISNDKLYGIEGIEVEIIKPRLIRYYPMELQEYQYNRRFIKKAEKVVIEHNSNMIYHRYSIGSYQGVALAKKFNIPLILEFNSSEVWQHKNWRPPSKKPLGRIKDWIFNPKIYNMAVKNEEYNLQNADLIVVVSDLLKQDIVNCGIKDDKIIVNPNCVDLRKFKPQSEDNIKTLKNKLGIECAKTVVGFCGTFSHWHGITVYTEAIKEINRDNSNNNLVFLMIGDGSQKRQMKEELSPWRNVIFTGTVPYDEVQNYLSICDLFVSPHCQQVDGREFFGSPTKLFEYMAMGKGIIVSNLGQMRKVLRHNDTAYLIEPGNIDELKEAIVYLGHNRDIADRMGGNALREVKENYTWEHNIKRIMERIAK